MHITISAVGSRGDVQPFVALGIGLQREGHVVRVATHDIHADLVREHGLEFATMGGNPRELMESLMGQAWLKSGRNPLAFWRRFRKLTQEKVEESLDAAVEACRGTEAVIFTFFGASGYHVAEMMRVPHLMGVLQPFSRTREFPSTLFPSVSLGRTYNWLTYLLVEEMAWQTGRRWVNPWRQGTLGLDPFPSWGAFSRLYSEDVPFLYGFSEHVVPRPRDWPSNHEVAGYWFLEGSPSWSPPPALLDFLSSGPEPIYIGFGSMAGRVAEELTDIAIDAVKLAKCRAILLGGWAATDGRNLPDSVLAMRSAPHDWLFPRMAAVVHHGGAGTTAAGLRAGVPTLVVPFFADQPFWGGRVHRLGAGPEPISRRRLSARTLSDSIARTVSDPEIRGTAAALGRRLREEDGVARGVERVIHYLDR
jgi:UDP:flavonoid glycosyltransferase YjiC (YdhE family)